MNRQGATIREVLFLVNPKAGGGRALGLDWQKVCASLPFSWRVVMPSSPQDALQHAQRFCDSEEKVLVVVGGDGTIHAVLPALVGSPCALAFLPAGTSNVLARELGYPLGRKAIKGCLQALRHGEVRQMDVGVVNGRPFALMTSTGFDAFVLERVSDRLKRRIGVFAFIWTGLLALRHYQPAQYWLQVGQETHELEAVMLVVSNTSRYGWFTVIAPPARIDDGVLDVMALPAHVQWRQRIWRVAWDVLRNRADHCPYLLHLRARSLHIECARPQPFQCDGELVGWTPMDVSLLSNALRVIAASPPAPSHNVA